jgi:glycosyltransferase involved in cell wall biosynthesis
VLQEAGVAALSADLRHKARVIPISMDGETFAFCRRLAERRPVAAAGGTFDVCVLGHLRTVKDPFRAAEAARIIPASSRVRIHHIGAALDETMRAEARRQEAGNPRYRWLGELPRRKALRILASCPLMALTSEMEGAANVVTEALAVGTPIVASRIPGLVGRLGEDYPGFFPFGDTHALAHLLHRAETEPQFYEQLCSRCADLLPLIDPVGEQRSWVTLLAEAAASRT